MQYVSTAGERMLLLGEYPIEWNGGLHWRHGRWLAGADGIGG